MNTKEQAINLATKATDNLDKKKGAFTLTFFDDTKKEVNVLNINSNLDKDGFSCVLTTFTTDINNTTHYDISDLKDIN